MFNWVYDRTTNEFLFGGSYDPAINPALHGVATVIRHPNARLERYDGTGGIRPATAQEITNYDAARVTEQSLSRFDNEKLVKALALWVAGKLNVPVATAKQEILAILRGL